jgi:UDP-N-acetylmuramate--alanine ligase
MLSVVTNIDADHMETYGHDFARLKGAFVDFLHRMPFYGAAIVCADDPGVRSIIPMLSRPVVSYGLDEDVQVRAVDVQALPGGQMRFTVQRRNGARCPICRSPEPARRAQRAQRAGGHRRGHRAGTARRADRARAGRLQRRGPALPALWRVPARSGGHFTLIDDYGHHPVEMAATLAAARGAFPGRRLVLAFQPHRYTRTRDCFEDFVKVLGRPTRCC